jgi:hypothetical protein
MSQSDDRIPPAGPLANTDEHPWFMAPPFNGFNDPVAVANALFDVCLRHNRVAESAAMCNAFTRLVTEPGSTERRDLQPRRGGRRATDPALPTRRRLPSS